MAIDNNNSTTPENEKDLAQTPWWMVRSLEDFLGFTFDLDACALSETAKAIRYFSLEDGNDALNMEWNRDRASGRHRNYVKCVYVNPPFTNINAFIDKAVEQVERHNITVAMLIPNNPETGYRRKLKEVSDTFIEMPFRLKFLRPDGTEFLDKNGKPQGPKFSCAVGLITPLGLKVESRSIVHDFRVGFYDKGSK